MGPAIYAKHLVSGPRLPFTAAYFGSIALTLYFAIGVSFLCFSPALLRPLDLRRNGPPCISNPCIPMQVHSNKPVWQPLSTYSTPGLLCVLDRHRRRNPPMIAALIAACLPNPPDACHPEAAGNPTLLQGTRQSRAHTYTLSSVLVHFLTNLD
jgi:hypothetical protein